MNDLKSFASFAIGAGAGIIIGNLFAKRSGKETRHKIMQEFNETKDTAKEIAEKQLEEAKKFMNEEIAAKAKNGQKAIDDLKKVVTFN